MPGLWSERAACRGWPTEWWFPGGEFYGTRRAWESKADAATAMRICRELCPVRADCLFHALKYAERGIWGATTEAERRKLRSRTRVA